MSSVPALFAVVVALLAAVAARRVTAVARARRIAFEQIGTHELADLFIFLDGAALARAVSIVLLAVPLLFYVLSGSAVVAALIATGILVTPSWAVSMLRKRRTYRLARALPDAMLALASLVRAGAGLSAALSSLPRYLQRPLADEVSLLVRQLRLGVAMQAAVRQWAVRIGSHEARAFASLLSVVHAQGGALAPALEQLAEAGRRRLAMEDRIDALTAQGRLQGVIVTLLPLAVAAVLWWLDAAAMRPLVESQRGLAVCALVILLQLAGWWGIRRVTDIRV